MQVQIYVHHVDDEQGCLKQQLGKMVEKRWNEILSNCQGFFRQTKSFLCEMGCLFQTKLDNPSSILGGNDLVRGYNH